MKHIFKYNLLLFTEESRNGNPLHNMKFWNLLSDFELKHPEIDMTVIHYLKWERPIGKYAEYLDFQCSQSEAYTKVQAMYDQYYYLTPLTFQPFLDRVPADEEVHTVES